MLAVYLLDENSTDFDGFYNSIANEVICPNITRVGHRWDGGKWTCKPDALPENCVAYSLGVGSDISFELDIDKITKQRCKMYSFDPDERLGRTLLAMKSERFVFLAYAVGGETDEAKRRYTVQDIMKQQKHNIIDFFKIDIEGGEFHILPSLLADRKKPIACQLFIEMHGNPSQIGLLLQDISKAGYFLFSKEINRLYPQYCEFSFIHEQCFKRHGVDGVLLRNFSTK